MSRKKITSFTDSDFVVTEKPAPPLPEDAANDLPATGNMVKAEAVETATPKPTTGIITFAVVPIPKRKGRTSKVFYPINVLRTGSEDSFFVASDPKDFKKVATKIRLFGYKNGFKVITSEEDTENGTGVRVWRKV